MSTLVNVPKNGSLSNTNSNVGFQNWSSWIDSFFNNDLPTLFNSNFNTGITLPKVNIRETADSYLVEMAVPGLKKSDFKIDLDNQTLCISAELNQESNQEQDSYTKREYGYSSFKRSFSLPETVEDSKINAAYKDGILTIHLPKKEEAKQQPPKSIKVT